MFLPTSSLWAKLSQHVELSSKIFLHLSLTVIFCLQIDNKGNHLLVSEEASINVPAIAAAHVTKRYTAQATDELTFEVNSYFWCHHNDYFSGCVWDLYSNYGFLCDAGWGHCVSHWHASERRHRVVEGETWLPGTTSALLFSHCGFLRNRANMMSKILKNLKQRETCLFFL